MSGRIEIRAESIVGCWPAVPDSAPSTRQEVQQCARLQRERMVLAVAGAEQPADFPPDADAVARHARLRYLEYCAPDSVAVSNAHLVIGQAFDGEVLAELAANEVIPPELSLPVAIGIDR